ncbi:MAG: hypothetical protein IPM31_16670 [Anaerolineae bacterium]|nr:hypothetical protein [Anaerolineae bacterium]
MRTTSLLLLVAVSVGACSTLPQNTVNPSATTVMVTETGTTVAQIAPSKIATAIPDVTTLQVENFDFSNRVVELSDLKLKPTTRILVLDPKSDQVLAISDNSIDPVFSIQSKANILRSGISMSPDRRWFAYLVIDEGFNIWISSVDGTQHFVGIKNAIGSSFRWLNNEKIIVYDRRGLGLDCPSEMQIFNPFSGDVNNVPDISTQGSQYCFPIPYFNPDFSQVMYLNSELGWQIYDYRTQTSYSVLPGLNTSPGGEKSYFYWGKDGLSFAIPDSGKITYAFDLPDTAFLSKPTVSTISLPKGMVNENALFTFWIPEDQIIGLDLVATGEKIFLGCDIPQTFATINLATRTLNNYCLNRSLFYDQIGGAWFMYISADHRFVGWTIRELPSNEEPLGVVILDTETGKLSYLEGYELLGFGELGP